MKKLFAIALGAIGTATLLGVALTGVALSPRMSSTEFCISCHEMQTPFEEYRHSAHDSSASGVRAECKSCHIPQPIGPKLADKVGSLKELHAHYTGVLATPELFEQERARLAQSVWTYMKETDSRECRSCHKADGFNYAEFADAEGGERMRDGLAQGQTCIDCHKGIAHEMPDLSSGYKKMHEDLVALGADVPAKAETLYPVDMVDSFGAKDGDKEGRILAATSLQVLGADGGWLNVRVNGWVQEGAEGVIYELQGKRIFSVALAKSARETPVVLETILDADTEQTWHKVTYDAWVENTGLVESRDSLWEYGATMHRATCGACHQPTPAGHFLANQWIGTMKDMQRYIKQLDKGQYRFLQKYLQLHAKDVAGNTH